jgi:hypothetical protein
MGFVMFQVNYGTIVFIFSFFLIAYFIKKCGENKIKYSKPQSLLKLEVITSCFQMIIGHDHNSPLLILTNHTPPTNSLTSLLTFHVNVGPNLTLSQNPLIMHM